MMYLERVPLFHCAVLLPKCIAKGFCDIFAKEDKMKHLFSSNNYWSSTTNAGNENNAWNVNFNNGNVNNNNKNNNNYVRCVRDGEWNV